MITSYSLCWILLKTCWFLGWLWLSPATSGCNFPPKIRSLRLGMRLITFRWNELRNVIKNKFQCFVMKLYTHCCWSWMSLDIRCCHVKWSTSLWGDTVRLVKIKCCAMTFLLRDTYVVRASHSLSFGWCEDSCHSFLLCSHVHLFYTRMLFTRVILRFFMLARCVHSCLDARAIHSVLCTFWCNEDDRCVVYATNGGCSLLRGIGDVGAV